MIFNYSKLKGKIIEVFQTQSKFAHEIGLSERSLSLKLNNKVPFKQIEIIKTIEVLNLSIKDIDIYFFTLLVQ